MASQDIDQERARVECVFSLGGGELHVPDARFPDDWDGVFAHWYGGPPEYATELRDAHEVTCPTCKGTKIVPADEGSAECPACEGMGHLDLEVRTAIICCIFGFPAPPEGWTQVASYSSSGERECWCCGVDAVGDEEDHEPDGCELCAGDGYVYLGDGWAEVVYRRVA